MFGPEERGMEDRVHRIVGEEGRMGMCGFSSETKRTLGRKNSSWMQIVLQGNSTYDKTDASHFQVISGIFLASI